MLARSRQDSNRRRRSPADTINHALYPVAAVQKFELLIALLERTQFDSVLIFCRTKEGADRIARQLKVQNHSVAVLHSNRTQVERVEALEGFKNGRYEVMVATDIAARGIDIAGVSHVINYDVPQHPEDYVHRIGRTGRAQNVGDAFTIMTAEELPHVKEIEHFIAQKIPRLKLENFSYIYSAIFDEEAAKPPSQRQRCAVAPRHVFGVRRRVAKASHSGSSVKRHRAHVATRPPANSIGRAQFSVGNIPKNFVVPGSADSATVFLVPSKIRRALRVDSAGIMVSCSAMITDTGP